MLGTSTNRGFAIWFWSPGNILVCQAANGTNDSWNNSRITNGDTYLPDNSWGHITFTHEQTGTGAIQKIYINGIIRNTYTSVTTDPVDYYDKPFYIGVRTNGADEYRGKIANIKCYNRALSQTEITRNYNAFKSRFI